jgi:hypothetical protein
MATKKDKGADVGQGEVQEKMDEATEKGFIGSVPDPTDNEAYTVGGVTSGAPTPETDADLAAKARQATDAGRAGVVEETTKGGKK